MLVRPPMALTSLLPTCPPFTTYPQPPGLDTALQLQNEASSTEDGCDSSDDVTMNGEVEDISPEDFMVIGELDHLIMMLDRAAVGRVMMMSSLKVDFSFCQNDGIFSFICTLSPACLLSELMMSLSVSAPWSDPCTYINSSFTM